MNTNSLPYITTIKHLPQITSKAWLLFNARSYEVLCCKGEYQHMEIASLTKIMTAYIAIKFAINNSLDPHQLIITVPEEAAYIDGTTAELYEGDKLSLYDILHGLLLPSGNDAAMSIAIFIGSEMQKMMAVTPNVSSERIFIDEMNRVAKALEMNNTTFANPHGLEHFFNRSCCIDLAKLASAAMLLDLFREIVCKKTFHCNGLNKFKQNKLFYWTNTNKMLLYGYIGVKTGFTPSAGPCLISYYSRGDIDLIVILLKCKSADARWKETNDLVKWYCSKVKKPHICNSPRSKSHNHRKGMLLKNSSIF